MAPSSTGNSRCQPVSPRDPLLSSRQVRRARSGAALMAVNRAITKGNWVVASPPETVTPVSSGL